MSRAPTRAVGSVFAGQTVPDPENLLSLNTVLNYFLRNTTEISHNRPVGVNIAGRKFDLRPISSLTPRRVLTEASSVMASGNLGSACLPQYVSDGVAVTQHVEIPAHREAEVAMTAPPPLTNEQTTQLAMAHFWVACARLVVIDDLADNNDSDSDSSDSSESSDSDDDDISNKQQRPVSRRLQRATAERARFAATVACAYAAVGWTCDWYDVHRSRSLFAPPTQTSRRRYVKRHS